MLPFRSRLSSSQLSSLLSSSSLTSSFDKTNRHVGLLTVQGKKFQIEPLPLKTVRPFVMRQIAMADAAEDDGLDLENKQKVTEYLRAQVRLIPFEKSLVLGRKES